MARKRFVTSDMSIDEKIAEIAAENPVAALMWPWFITGFDDWGRMEAVPMKIKLSIFPAFPYTPKDIEEAIDLYDKFGIVHKYEVDGKEYIAVEPEKYYKYQTYIRGSKREIDGSNCPPPPNPPWGNAKDSTEKHTEHDRRADARTCVQVSADERKCIPSPSPSPSPSMNVKAVGEYEGETESQQPAIPITDYERNCLNILKSVKDYPFDFEKDLDMTRTFMVEFPMLDIYAEYQRWREYKRDKPLKNRSSPRLQLRNWMEKGQKFLEQGVRSNGRASPRGIGSHKGRAGTWTSLESIVIDGAGDEASSAG